MPTELDCKLPKTALNIDAEPFPVLNGAAASVAGGRP